MLGLRFRVGGSPGLKTLPRMPIRHRRIEQQHRSSEETESLAPAEPKAHLPSGPQRARPPSVPMPF